MKVYDEQVYCVPIQFVLRPNKQKLLINILEKYCCLSDDDLCFHLATKKELISGVVSGDYFLNYAEASRLINLFCLSCGG